MVDSISGSGGVPPVKNINKTMAKPSEVEQARDFDAVQISDEAVALAQAVETRAQLAGAPDVVLSDNPEAIKSAL